jgi:hypothetical protein
MVRPAPIGTSFRPVSASSRRRFLVDCITNTIWRGGLRRDGLNFCAGQLAESLSGNLNCYVAAKASIAGFPDLAHAAHADGRKDFVWAEPRSGGKAHFPTGSLRLSSSKKLNTIVTWVALLDPSDGPVGSIATIRFPSGCMS